jgi:predicted component of type VI protein secretion system
MALPLFIIEGIAASGPVSLTLHSISPELALYLGKRDLIDAHGKVRKVTVRYAASTHLMTAADFADENRDENDG